MAKLNYKILGRRPLEGTLPPLEAVDVEWSHADGPVSDHVLLPTNHPPIHPSMPGWGKPSGEQIQYAEVEDGKRAVIKDQVNVPIGAHDDEVEAILIKKRQALAANLGIEA